MCPPRTYVFPAAVHCPNRCGYLTLTPATYPRACVVELRQHRTALRLPPLSPPKTGGVPAREPPRAVILRGGAGGRRLPRPERSPFVSGASLSAAKLAALRWASHRSTSTSGKLRYVRCTHWLDCALIHRILHLLLSDCRCLRLVLKAIRTRGLDFALSVLNCRTTHNWKCGEGLSFIFSRPPENV